MKDIDIQDIFATLRFLSIKNFRITPEGGYAIRVINNTGSATEKGRLVKADTSGGLDMAVELTGANDEECIGAFYEDDIADGEYCWVCIGGIVEVLLNDNTGTSVGNWAQTGAAGYCDGAQAAPVPATHWQEIGHIIEAATAGGAGTHQLIKIIMHFN